MLTTCPECELQISDKALVCPHCGFPLKKNAQVYPRKANKRRRLPNGFGQISEIKGQNLRRPFRAMVTVGKTEDGKPIRKPLLPQSYFKTYNDAYLALLSYNKNPYELVDPMTMQQLFDKWYGSKVGKVCESTLSRYRIAWNYSSLIWNKPVQAVTISDLRNCIEYGTIIYAGVPKHAENNTVDTIKSMYNLLFDYAVAYDIIDKNIARQFTVDSGYVRKPCHIPYTDDEMKLLWDHLRDYDLIDMVLIQCYSGWRPGELCDLKIKDVDLGAKTMTGGKKTKAGINRVVPIHPRIMSLIELRYNDALEHKSPYLFNNTVRGVYKKVRYARFNEALHDITEELHLNPEHKGHDGRKHFITMAKKYNMDEYALKWMVGHYINDLTERIYTKRSTDWLMMEISKIP